MIHHELDAGGHWATSPRSNNPNLQGVLVQLGDAHDGAQARVLMTRDEAIAFATSVLENSRLPWNPKSIVP